MVPLVGFDDDLYKKSIPIGATVNIIDLRNGTLIAKMKKTPLLHVGDNTLILIAQACECAVSIYDYAKHNGGKYYIHDNNQVIPMNFDKYLVYVTISKPKQWNFDNIDSSIVVSYYL